MGLLDRLKAPLEDEGRTLQYEKVEQTRIDSSRVYEDIKAAAKKAFYLACLVALVYGIYRVFSFWFFAGIVASALPLGFLVVQITRVPKTLVLAMHISDEASDRDYIGFYSIPNKMMEEFKRVGSDFHYLTTYEGTNIAMCDDIDFDEWTITTPWFSEISNLEFFRNKQAFTKLKQMYVDELRENGADRALHSAKVYKHVIDELQKHYTKFDQVMFEPEVEEKEDSYKAATDEISGIMPGNSPGALGIDVYGSVSESIGI